MPRTNNSSFLPGMRRRATIAAVSLAVGIAATGPAGLTSRPVNAQTSQDAPMTEAEVGPSRVVDGNGRPIAGAAIEFTTQLKYAWLESPAPLATAVTNDQGEFSYPKTLPDLEQFFVIANADGFMERHWTANGDVYRKTDGVRAPDTLTLLRPATVTGTILDEQGRPLPDAEIAVDYYFDAGPSCINCIRVKSDASGRFTATNVPPANVFVRHQSPSTDPAGEWPGPTGVQPARLCIVHRQPADGETIDVTLDLRMANRVVEGRVVDPEGRGLPGVAVEAGYFPAVQRLDETIAVKTDADGGFRFTGLTPDTFVIMVSPFGPSDTVSLSKDAPEKVVLTVDKYRRGSEPLPADVERTAWGEPNAEGLVAGLRLEPAADSYAMGDVVTAHVVVRNPTNETKTFQYSFSGQADLHALDSQGNVIGMINYFKFTGLNAIFSYSLEPGQVSEVGSFSAALVAAEDTENSPPPTTFAIACPQNEQVVLRCYLSQQPENGWVTGDAQLKYEN